MTIPGRKSPAARTITAPERWGKTPAAGARCLQQPPHMTTAVANCALGLLLLLANGPVFAAPWSKGAPSVKKQTRTRFEPRSRCGVAAGLGVCRAALRQIPGQTRACVVVDIDNTLVDTRARTQAAAAAFARQKPALGLLASLPLSRVGYDGRATARALGLEHKEVEAFHAHWDRFFWRPQNFRFDRPIRQTVQLTRQAKAAGAEVFYLTGRIESLKPTTLAQLRRLGLPDADGAHVLCKPSMGLDTAAFKRKAVQGLLKNGHRVAWFMSDSRRDIKAVQGLIPARSCVLVDFPVQPAGVPPCVQPGTPILRLR